MLNSWALAFLIFILLRVALLRSAKVTHVSLLNRVTARFFFLSISMVVWMECFVNSNVR